MKKILFVLMCILLYTSTYSQSCESDFIERFTKAYSKNEKWLNKRARTIYRKYGDIDSLYFIFIPEISIQRGLDEKEIEPDNILCMIKYWNRAYTKVLVFKNSELLGLINVFYKEYTPILSENIKAMKDVYEKVGNIGVNVVYNINGFSDNVYYWYIVGDQLYVLVEQDGIKTYNAQTYLHTIYNPSNIIFLKSIYYKNHY